MACMPNDMHSKIVQYGSDAQTKLGCINAGTGRNPHKSVSFLDCLWEKYESTDFWEWIYKFGSLWQLWDLEPLSISSFYISGRQGRRRCRVKSKSVVINPPSNYKKSSFLLTPPTLSYSSYTPPSIYTIIQPCIRVCCHHPLTRSHTYTPHTPKHTHTENPLKTWSSISGNSCCQHEFRWRPCEIGFLRCSTKCFAPRGQVMIFASNTDTYPLSFWYMLWFKLVTLLDPSMIPEISRGGISYAVCVSESGLASNRASTSFSRCCVSGM